MICEIQGSIVFPTTPVNISSRSSLSFSKFTVRGWGKLDEWKTLKLIEDP